MSTPMMSLWLPILLSGVALFFASWLAWMVLPHHKREWRGMPNEDSVLASLKSANLPPGQYMFPYAACKEDWKSDSFQAKQIAGPLGSLTVHSEVPDMGRNMLLTVLFFCVVNFSIAYLAAMVLPPGTEPRMIFRFVATAGIIVYAAANILNSIWFGRRMLADFLDGIAYGLITGAIFAAMWPTAVASMT